MFQPSSHILLTGGTGFFGLALLRHWQAQGLHAPRVTVLSRAPGRFAARYPALASLQNIRWAKGDVLQPGSLPEDAAFTHVLHAATDSTLGPQLSPLERYEQIVLGTRHMLDYAAAHKIGRFLLTSSGGVYGPQPPEMETIPESYNGMPDPLRPEHSYSVAKRAAEHLCALYQDRYGIQTVIARCFAFVGRDLPMDVHFAIGNFIRDALYAPEIVVGGDGTPIRSYLDQSDLAVWLMALLQHGTTGQAYNVGSDQAISIRDLAVLVRKTLSPDKPVRIAGKSGLANFRNRYVPSIEKSRVELKLEVTVSLQDAIKEAAIHQSKQASL